MEFIHQKNAFKTSPQSWPNVPPSPDPARKQALPVRDYWLPVHSGSEHSHGKSTVLMVFTRKDVSGRVSFNLIEASFLSMCGPFGVCIDFLRISKPYLQRPWFLSNQIRMNPIMNIMSYLIMSCCLYAYIL